MCSFSTCHRDDRNDAKLLPFSLLSLGETCFKMHHWLSFLVNHLGLDHAEGAVRLFLGTAEVDWASQVLLRDEIAELSICRPDVSATATITAPRSVGYDRSELEKKRQEQNLHMVKSKFSLNWFNLSTSCILTRRRPSIGASRLLFAAAAAPGHLW